MLEAIKLCNSEGIKLRMMHIRYANPFASKSVLSALTKAAGTHGKIVIFEGNSEAQMRELILVKTGYHIEKTYLRYDGRPFTPEEIAAHAKKVLGK
jgi:pyruvate/2-oxoacid:ferredoxin oxidoreductase alpha subunit